MEGKHIGILHPGQMGISLAATLQNGGHSVHWASQGRSPQTRRRADEGLDNVVDAVYSRDSFGFRRPARLTQEIN